MNTQTTKQYHARLTLPHSTVSINSTDLNTVQNSVRALCKAESINPSFDNESNETAIYVLDEQKQPIGYLGWTEVPQHLSVMTTINQSRQGRVAA